MGRGATILGDCSNRISCDVELQCVDYTTNCVHLLAIKRHPVQVLIFRVDIILLIFEDKSTQILCHDYISDELINPGCPYDGHSGLSHSQLRVLQSRPAEIHCDICSVPSLRAYL